MTALEMDPQIRARWVAALRSGKYEQGREFLRTEDDRFCCLGVLCELAVADGVIPPAWGDGSEWVYADASAELPDRVMQWAGLPSIDPVIPAEMASLAGLNDGDEAVEREPWTFAQIADAIEGGAS